MKGLYLGICQVGLASMKTALGRSPTNRKWGRGIPGRRSSMSKGTKVGEYRQIWETAEQRRKEGWSIVSAKCGAGLLTYIIARGR